jgi:uncharacterized protein
MSRIEIGRANGRAVNLDLQTLLRTRMLVQANSGGGKSYALRRMAEQLFGKVPVWIVDPEGEFASLRERFGYVLVGKGGETPADARSVELVVHRLLEHGASAVFDLYDLKPQARHHYVRTLADALMNVPKALWKPLVFKLDEAHLFAPEKGQGESEAFGAVQDVATRGRKRGICLVAYTQRLAKISKNVTAELLNRMVGMTFEGVDVDRAAEVLTVPKDEREYFKARIKSLEPGEFFGLGPAIAKERTLLRVGGVLTTHPEPGTTAAAAPPPAPEKIKHLLPKLADLPKEAETKAKTEGELRAEIRSLKAQLAARPTAVVEKPKVERVEVPVVKAPELARIEKLITTIKGPAQKLLDELRDLADRIQVHTGFLVRRAAKPVEAQVSLKPTLRKVVDAPAIAKDLAVPLRAVPAPRREDDVPTELSRPQLKILEAMAMFEALGFSDIPRTWIAPMADTTHSSSGFEKNCSTLNTKGYIEYGAPKTLRMRPEGRGEVGNQPEPTAEFVLNKCRGAVSGPQCAILNALSHAYPSDMSREEIAAAVQSTVTSSGFEKNMSTLRTAGMIEYSGQGRARLSAWVMAERRGS